MPRTNNRPIPAAHHDIVRIIEAVRTRAIPDPLLALLELFEKLEVSWYWIRTWSARARVKESGCFTLGWHMCDLIVI